MLKDPRLKKYIPKRTVSKRTKEAVKQINKSYLLMRMEVRFEKLEGFFTWPRLYEDMVSLFPDGSVFVELGVYKGQSLYYLLWKIFEWGKNIKVFGIDYYEDMSTGMQDQVVHNLAEFDGKYNIIKKDSALAAQQFEDDSVDFLFIDAGHEFEEVKNDILAWLPKMKKDGIIAGHDYDGFNKGGGYPGVKKAVDGIFGKKVSKEYFDENCWLVKNIKDVSKQRTIW